MNLADILRKTMSEEEITHSLLKCIENGTLPPKTFRDWINLDYIDSEILEESGFITLSKMESLEDDLEKAWPKEYSRVKGQDKNLGTSSKAQYNLMRAAAAGKVDDISPEDAKEYVKNSPKKGEGLPEKGTGGARGSREKKHAEKKKDKAEKIDDAGRMKEKYSDMLPKPVPKLEDDIKRIKEKYKDREKKSLGMRFKESKQKCALEKRRDAFYAKIEGSLEKSANEELLSNFLDADLILYKNNNIDTLNKLYTTVDKFFDATMSKEEQIVHELSYLAKNGDEDSEYDLVLFAESMIGELKKNIPLSRFIHDVICNSLEKSNYKDKLKGGLADNKKPKEFDEKQLEAGIKVEYEHTNNKSIAREIAMDHLTEDKDYYKKLKIMEDGGLDDKAEKSNYGPKGMDLYSEKDNINRKSRRVGTVHENVGQNKAEYKYTPSVSGTFAEQSKREASVDKKKSAKSPVKVYSDEEKKALQEKYEREKKTASEDNSAVVGKRNGESVRRVHGYLRYTSGSRRGEYVHRHEAEKRLGRNLSSKEHVDHKSGNRRNNSLENLKVKSISDHTADTNKKRAKTKNGTVSGGKKVEHTGSH